MDIILNFTSMNFISGLDEIGYELALWGKYGPKLENKAKRIGAEPLPECMRFKPKYAR